MASQQSYGNHRRYLPIFHFVILPILAINVLLEAFFLYRHPSWYAVWAIVVGLTLLALAVTSRFNALTVQDRLIALEERLRLQQILPEDLRLRMGELHNGDLIALRFCDDAEVTDLTRAVLAGEIKGRDEIKRRIQTWRPDWHRV